MNAASGPGGIFYGLAALFVMIGTAVSVLFNLAFLVQPSPDMDQQTYPWFGFWICVYSFLPASLLYVIHAVMSRVRETPFLLLAPTLLAFVLNVAVLARHLLS